MVSTARTVKYFDFLPPVAIIDNHWSHPRYRWSTCSSWCKTLSDCSTPHAPARATRKNGGGRRARIKTHRDGILVVSCAHHPWKKSLIGGMNSDSLLSVDERLDRSASSHRPRPSVENTGPKKPPPETVLLPVRSDWDADPDGGWCWIRGDDDEEEEDVWTVDIVYTETGQVSRGPDSSRDTVTALWKRNVWASIC